MFNLEFSQWLELIQAAVWILGGIWALYIYSSSRRGSVRVGIEHSARLVENFDPDHFILIVELSLRNTSDVLWRHDKSEVTVFDARKLAANRTVRLVPFRRADPFLPAYGATSDTSEEFERGTPFFYFEGQEVMLEPGEEVRIQIAFPLDREKLGLMALKVWISGFQRKRSKTPYEWTSFFYVDPKALQDGSRNQPDGRKLEAS